jgi:hypothetical protein
MCDEFVYAGIAKSLASSGQFAFRHEPNTVSLLYPALIAPAWWAHSMDTAYGLAKTINACVMTLAAIPFFFWARRISSPLYALVATALLLLLPAFDYTAMLMTENAFFPAVIAATYAIARSLERPTVAAQLLVVAAIVVALAVRAQAAALVLVLPSAVLLNAALDRGSESVMSRLGGALKRQWLALGGLVALGLAYGAVLMARGTGRVPYREVFLANYSLLDGVRVSVYHLAALTLELGVVPVSALIVVTGLAIRAHKPTSRATRAFVAVALPTILWFLLEIGLFGSRFASNFPVERYSFYLEPLFLLGLVAWLHQGLPRPRVLTVFAVLVPVGLVVWFPLSKFIQDSPVYSSFGLYYFFNLVKRLSVSPGHVELLASVGAVLAGLLFVLIPRRLGPIVLALPLAVFFAAVSRSAFISLDTYGSYARYETGLGRDSSWIEQAVGRNRPVTVLYTGANADFVASQTLMQTEFWNRNVTAVANIGPKELCPLPEKDGRLNRSSGKIKPVAGQHGLFAPIVVTSGALGLAGRRLASHTPFVAYRIRRPPHVTSEVGGIYADGWTGSTATISKFEPAPPGSRLLVDVSRASWAGPDKPGAVSVRVKALTGRVLETRKWVIHSGTARTFRLPAPQEPYSVELRVRPTFTPADYGLPDSRSLGAKFAVRVVPQSARRAKAQ